MLYPGILAFLSYFISSFLILSYPISSYLIFFLSYLILSTGILAPPFSPSLAGGSSMVPPFSPASMASPSPHSPWPQGIIYSLSTRMAAVFYSYKTIVSLHYWWWCSLLPGRPVGGDPRDTKNPLSISNLSNNPLSISSLVSSRNSMAPSHYHGIQPQLHWPAT